MIDLKKLITKIALHSRPSHPSEGPISLLLDRLYLQFFRLTRELPARPLLPGMRAKLSGYLFAQGPSVVRNVARGLCQKPHLFPEVPAGHGVQMLERLDRAEGWLGLHRLFAGLAEQCKDNHVLELSTAVREACDLADAVRAAAEHPEHSPHLDHQKRQNAISVALFYLAMARQEKGRRLKGPKAKGQPRPPLTPKQARAREEARAVRNAEFLAVIRDVTGKKPPRP